MYYYDTSQSDGVLPFKNISKLASRSIPRIHGALHSECFVSVVRARERANIQVTLTLTSEHKCWDRLQPLRQAKMEKQLRRRKGGRKEGRKDGGMDYIHKRKTVATLLKSCFVPVIKKGN